MKQSFRIFVTCPAFSPSVGGLETVAECLADEFAAMGHEVTLATLTAEHDGRVRPYRVLRAPGNLRLLRESCRADLVLQHQISLRLGLPSLLLGRPTAIAHHMWTPLAGPGALLGRVKHALLGRAVNIAVSRAMSSSIKLPCEVIPNPCPFDQIPSAGSNIPEPARDEDLAFVGRLVEGKGLGVLLDSLSILAARGHHPRLTVYGQGPAAALHQRQAENLGLGEQVRFAGTVQGTALGEQLRRHRVLVVPSVWDEPFGVVVLEGLAHGLLPIVAESGGLPEAVGTCGVRFPKGDSTALASVLEDWWQHPERFAVLRANVPAHLAKHAPRSIAERYLAAMNAHRLALGNVR